MLRRNLLLPGTILNRAYGTHKNLYISGVFVTIFGPIYYAPPPVIIRTKIFTGRTDHDLSDLSDLSAADYLVAHQPLREVCAGSAWYRSSTRRHVLY